MHLGTENTKDMHLKYALKKWIIEFWYLNYRINMKKIVCLFNL